MLALYNLNSHLPLPFFSFYLEQVQIRENICMNDISWLCALLLFDKVLLLEIVKLQCNNKQNYTDTSHVKQYMLVNLNNYMLFIILENTPCTINNHKHDPENEWCHFEVLTTDDTIQLPSQHLKMSTHLFTYIYTRIKDDGIK